SGCYAAGMRIALAVVLAAACSRAPRTVDITIDLDAVPTAVALGAQVEDTRDGIAVAELGEDRLEALWAAADESVHRCGGLQVHDSFADAEAALVPAPPHAPVDYTLDHGDAVRAILPQLDKQRILRTIGELSAMPTRYYRSTQGAAASEWL